MPISVAAPPAVATPAGPAKPSPKGDGVGFADVLADQVGVQPGTPVADRTLGDAGGASDDATAPDGTGDAPGDAVPVTDPGSAAAQILDAVLVPAVLPAALPATLPATPVLVTAPVPPAAGVLPAAPAPPASDAGVVAESCSPVRQDCSTAITTPPASAVMATSSAPGADPVPAPAPARFTTARDAVPDMTAVPALTATVEPPATAPPAMAVAPRSGSRAPSAEVADVLVSLSLAPAPPVSVERTTASAATVRIDPTAAPTTGAAPAAVPAAAGGAGAGPGARQESRVPADAPTPVLLAPASPATTAPQAAAPVTVPAPAPAPVGTPAALASQLSPRLVKLPGLGEGVHRLTLDVRPEAIGSVTVVAHIRPESVHIELVGATPAAHEALRGALEDLRRDLAATGSDASLDLGTGTSTGGGSRGDRAAAPSSSWLRGPAGEAHRAQPDGVRAPGLKPSPGSVDVLV